MTVGGIAGVILEKYKVISSESITGEASMMQVCIKAAVTLIEWAGCGVIRLWTTKGGVPEDDGLGLAAIENRRHTHK